jgi:hypothetical protein
VEYLRALVGVGVQLAIAALLVSQEVWAFEGVMAGEGLVPLWRSQAALEKGISLSPNSETLLSLYSCVVPSGTRVDVARVSGSYAWEAVVQEGDYRGCRGIIGPRDFNTPSELGASVQRAPTSPARKERLDAANATGSHWVLWRRERGIKSNGEIWREELERLQVFGTNSDCEGARGKLVQGRREAWEEVRARTNIRSELMSISSSITPYADGLDLRLEFGREGQPGWGFETNVFRVYCYLDPQRPE